MNNPIWNALAREAAISAEHLGAGATILGKASYAHHAHYGQAFFSLSTGIERGAKLALLVSHALQNNGKFPEQQQLRSYGHKLADLLNAVDRVAESYGHPAGERLPQTPIHLGIIKVLTEFASNITRYYNLDFVMGTQAALQRDDPVKAWFTSVTTSIVEEHLTELNASKIRNNARAIAGIGQHFMLVSHTSETGDHLGSVYDASVQTGINEFAKPYERMYVLQIARFFCHVMTTLTHQCYRARLEEVPHLSEFFAIYNNPDSYLRGRKSWSIYKP